jgi:hypothetical protein
MVSHEELPVYIITGSNWECEVAVDEDDFNLKLPALDYMVEAVTKSIEIVMGVVSSDNFRILNHDEAPYVGLMIHVYLKNTNPDKGAFIPSYLAFANGGFYKESVHAHQMLLEQQMEAASKNPSKANKKTKNKKKLSKDLNNFDKLRLQLRKGSKRKRKTPKKDK